MKKLIALLLALVMALSLAACAAPAADPAAPAADDGAAAAPEADVPADLPAYKVGVILYDLSNLWAQNIMQGIESLGKELNVTFEYAIGGTDPEAPVTAVQNFGAAGCDGILTLHPGAVMSTLVEICEENEMFIVSSNDPANASEDYASFSASPWFAGEVWEDDYEVAYEIATDMIANGAQTFALTGFPEGLSAQMDKRLQGARAAVADGGAEIVTEGLSFNKAEAAENILSQYPDIDVLFSSVETLSTAYQPIVNAGLADSIMMNCYDPAEGLLEAMQDGVIDYAVDGTMADSMIAFVLLYNAMSGHKMTQDDGSAASIQMQYVIAKSAEEYETILAYVSGENPPYTLAELAPYITVLNADASFSALRDYAGAFSLEDVIARRGA
ncbi:MAG: substrate-binding domain-containing protein [Clostridia bacterium]|nr:substrate-binding domain-containing protein [Clostridia bacterium]